MRTPVVAACGLLAVLALCSPAPVRGQSDAITPALIEQAAKANFPEFVDMLAMPNDAIVPDDIRKNVDWLDAAFGKRGFSTRQLANDGKPMLFAELPRKKSRLQDRSPSTCTSMVSR